jgi:delta24-sterol reductase
VQAAKALAREKSRLTVVEEVKMILGNGVVVRANQEGKNSDLFNGARCTLGALGVITLLRVRLTPAKDSVQLIYHHTSSVKETIDGLAKLCDDRPADFDFVEALQYSMDHGVIITGRHVSSTAGTVTDISRQRFDRAIDPWFYMHAKTTRESHLEIVPTQSYLFRHDRGAFWSGEVFLQYYSLPNNRLVRWLLDPIMTARAIYKAMLAANSADAAIVQDLLLPLEASEAFVEYTDRELNIWPLWICPVRKKHNAKDILGWPFYKSEDGRASKDGKAELTLNFGV